MWLAMATYKYMKVEHGEAICMGGGHLYGSQNGRGQVVGHGNTKHVKVKQK